VINTVLSHDIVHPSAYMFRKFCPPVPHHGNPLIRVKTAEVTHCEYL